VAQNKREIDHASAAELADRRAERRRNILWGAIAAVLFLIMSLLAVSQTPVAMKERKDTKRAGDGDVASAPPPTSSRDVVDLVSGETTASAWSSVLREFQRDFQGMGLALFYGEAERSCPNLGARGVFYCPTLKIGYFDMQIMTDIQRRAGADREVALAYAVAHVMAHHAQAQTGELSRAYAARGGRLDDLQSRLELKAECLAGAWARRAEAEIGMVTPGQIQRSMQAVDAAMADTTGGGGASGEPVLAALSGFSGPGMADRVDAFFRGYDASRASRCG
jgi:predicted metalloprotease